MHGGRRSGKAQRALGPSFDSGKAGQHIHRESCAAVAQRSPQLQALGDTSPGRLRITLQERNCRKKRQGHRRFISPAQGPSQRDALFKEGACLREIASNAGEDP